MVLMLKPSVGLMVVMSSPLMRRTMVVLPALSRPLQQHREDTAAHSTFSASKLLRAAGASCKTYTMSSRISFSFCLTFLMMVSSPMSPLLCLMDEVCSCNRTARSSGVAVGEGDTW